MARKWQLQFGAINITTPAPHRSELYIELFRQAGELDKVIKPKGDWVGKLGTLRYDSDTDGSAIVRGYGQPAGKQLSTGLAGRRR